MAALTTLATSTSGPAAKEDTAILKWIIAITVSIGALLEVIDTSIVNVALSDIQASLGATRTEVSWVVSGYGIANVIILPLAAWLGDRFGKKNYFLFSLVGFTVSSAACGLTTTFPMLVLARIVQGLTGGGLLAKAQAILFETFPKEQQAMAQGLFGAIVLGGPVIGPTLGGYLVTNVGWRWIFFVNIPVGVAASILAAIYLPRDPASKASPKKTDWAGIALLAIGIGSLQWVLEEGQTDGWFEDSLITTFFIVATVGLGAFVAWELRTKAPAVNLHVLRHRSLWAGSILSLVIGMVLYGAIFTIPLFGGEVMRFTSQQVGMLLLPGAIASALAMPLVARLMGRFDPRVLLIVGGLVLSASMFGLSGVSSRTGEGDLFVPLIARAVGTTFMFLPLQLAALGSLPKEDIPASSGLFNLMRQLGGSIGVALLSTLLDQRTIFHREILIEKLSGSDTGTLARLSTYDQLMLSKGVSAVEAGTRALALLENTVKQQASVLSYGDCFWATGALVAATLPLVFLFKKAFRGAGVPVVEH